MSEFACDWNGLKRIVSEFCKALPTATLEEADAGLKCVNLHFLSVTYADKLEEHQGVLLFDIVGKKYLQRQAELMHPINYLRSTPWHSNQSTAN